MNEVFVQARYLTSKGDLLVLLNYEVSNYGTVRNKKTNKILSVCHNHGYCIVKPYINDRQYFCQLHRLVLSSFTNNTDCSLQVNHKDENKENNTLKNLEWMTTKENTNYGTRNERAGKSISKAKKGVLNTKKSKPVLQYDINGNFIQEWPSLNEVQRQLGISNSSICQCCNGKRSLAGGFIWRYKE